MVARLIMVFAILPPYRLPLRTYPPIPHTPPTHPSCHPRNQNHGCLLCARRCSGSKFSARRGLPSKGEARALRLLPELHEHLSCVGCPGSFAHVAPVGLVLFALSACVRAAKAESRGLQVLCPVECLRSHTPAKFTGARALTHHPLRLWLVVRGGFFVLLVVGVRVGFFVLLVVVLTPKNVSASAGPSRLECHISAVVLAPYRASPRHVVSTARGSRICLCLVSIKRGSRGCGEQLWLGCGRGASQRCK
jgi:hypothetical protein